jgi:type IV pilus assembly protein PilB
VDKDIRKLIYDGANQDLIRASALKSGMRTLHDAAVSKMKRGITTIREVIKLTIVE